ncbi:MAG: hypothetical protein ACOY4Q_04450 [Bacillota bacterium]
MTEKLLAIILLVLGGLVTLYVLYKTALGALEPMMQKKLEQKMQQDELNQLQNNLQAGQQLDRQKVQETKDNMQ